MQFQILVQPEAEITRNVYFDFRIRLLQATKQSLATSSQPSAELIYENNNPVPASDSILDAQFAVRETTVHIRARIKELSKAHRGQRFRLRVTVHGVVAVSSPIKVLSKSSIVKAHKVALAGPVATPSPTPSAAPSSGSAAVSAPIAPALLLTPAVALHRPAVLPAAAPAAPAAPTKSVPSVTGQKRRAEDAGLAEEQRSLRDDVHALRGEVRALVDSVASLRDVLASFFGAGLMPAAKQLHLDTVTFLHPAEPTALRDEDDMGPEFEINAVD